MLPPLSLAVCVAATRTVWLLPETRRLPTGVVGPLRQIGFSLSQFEVALLLAALIAGYLLAIRWIDELSPRSVICAIIALNLVALLGPPLFSTDVFSYQAYARMFALYHSNPYLHGPSAIASNPIYSLIGPKWVDTASVYGPLFTFLSGAFASMSIAAGQISFRLVAAAASGGTSLLIWRCARLRRLDPVRGVALFGLNPLVTLYGVSGGHNDLLMLVLSTGAIYGVLSRRDRLGGALVSAAAAVKLAGGLILPFALLSDLEREAPRRRAFLIGFLVVTIVIALASIAVFGAGILKLPGTLGAVQDRGTTWKSGPGSLFAATGLHPNLASRVVVDLILIGCLSWLLREVWRARMDWLEGAAWATFAMLVTAWSFVPSYVSWTLPLVALCRTRRLWDAALVLTAIAGVMMIAETLPNGLAFL
jgi:hypothetical protein